MSATIDAGFVDLERWRTVEVAGADAVTWLDALVTADLRGIAPGEAPPVALAHADRRGARVLHRPSNG